MEEVTFRAARRAAVAASVLVLAACSGGNGDPPAQVTPDSLGSGSRIRDVGNPNLANHPVDHEPNGPHPNVNITGAALSWIDTFDETMDGKSLGTVFVQDVGSVAPYSGISIFRPAYVPADLRVAPGDVLDFNGPYEELPNIGTAKFPTGQVLIQLSKPVGVFRYEYKAPDAAMIDVNDLNDYDKGRQWEGMLVTVTNITLFGFHNDGTGRVTSPITNDMTGNGVAISNELMPIVGTDPVHGIMGDYPPGTKFSSVTGLVTWFFSYHIAPRSKADLVVAQ
jgi:hypothetical protein